VKTLTARLKGGRNAITIRSHGANLAGFLYTPQDSAPSKKLSGRCDVFRAQPKQGATTDIYGPPLAPLDYVVIGFDHLGYGDSDGEIRKNENAFVKIGSVRDAILFNR